ncbi:MAG: hypothetical protein D6701_02910 [Gemmatimonadetes bacterium]|nr:MAG: hypothetical protein D6701_02910 [Gemmatimonadota bacterium]
MTTSRIRRFAASALVGVLVLSLGACGSGDQAQAGDGREDAPPRPGARDSLSAGELGGLAREDILLTGPWMETPINRDPGAAPRSTLGSLQVYQAEGVDRVLFEFPGNWQFPGYRVTLATGNVPGCSEGDSIDVGDEPTLVIRLRPVTRKSQDGSVAVSTTEAPVEFDVLRSLRLACEDNDVLVWTGVLAVARPFRVLELQSPRRLAVDVRHATPEPAANDTVDAGAGRDTTGAGDGGDRAGAGDGARD